MEREKDFPAERAIQAFTDLGRALEAYNTAMGSHLESVRSAVQDAEHASAVVKAATPEEAPDPIGEQYRAERAQYEREAAEFQQLAAVLGNTIGVTSPAAEASKASTEISQLRKQMIDVQEAFDRGLIDLKETERELKRLNRQLALAGGKEAAGTSAEASGGSRWGKLARSAAPHMIDATKKGMQAVANQVSGVGSGLLGKLGGALPVAGGLAIFGLMLWGFKEADRMRAEFGELVNIAVAAGGGAHSQGMAWMAGFQERAQKFYGISRKEVQGVFKHFVEAGLSMDQIFRTVDKGLGEAGTNAIALSIAADRHFELSTGATSKAASQAVTHYGMELGRAVDMLTDVQFAAHHAGFGVGSLVSWTLSATSNVRHLGIGLEEVAFAAIQMRQFYAKAGLDSEKWAKDSVSQMLQGFQQMDMGRQFWAAEQLGFGRDVEGRNQLMEGLYRKDPHMMHKLAAIWRKDAQKAGGGSEMVSRFYLEKQGFGVEGAKAVMEVGDEADDDGKVHKKKREDRQKLRKSFQEESMKVSDLKKKMAQMLAGFAKMGQGMMQMLTGFMALLIVTVKGLPYLFMGTGTEEKRVLAMMQTQIGAISWGARSLVTGGKEAGDAIWSIMKPMMMPMIRAWEFNPYIAHLSKEELAAFEDDENLVGSASGKVAGVMGGYGMLSGKVGKENFYRLYGVDPESGADIGRPVGGDAKTPYPDINDPKPPATPLPRSTPSPKPPAVKPGTEKPAENVPSLAPKPEEAPPKVMLKPGPPIKINLGGEQIELGKNETTVDVEWEGDPNAENLELTVTYG